MSASRMVHMRDGVRVTFTALCQWERAPEGGLRAAWRRGIRVVPGVNAGVHTTTATVQLTRDGQQVHAVSRFGERVQQRPIDRWIAAGFIGALYLLTAFAGIAIVAQA